MYQFPHILEMVVQVVTLVPPGCALQRTIEQVVDVRILQIMHENINREGRSCGSCRTAEQAVPVLAPLVSYPAALLPRFT